MHFQNRDNTNTKPSLLKIRLCDGENRLKARGGHGSLTGGKGEPSPETEPIFLAGENWHVLEITNLVIQGSFHHGFKNASACQCHARISGLKTTIDFVPSCLLRF